MKESREILEKRARTDHLGVEYASVAEMCKKHGISERVYHNAVMRGLPKEEALVYDTSIGTHAKDHNGNVYKNIDAMCTAYGICTATYKSRINRNWSLKDALTVTSRKAPNSVSESERTDHKGMVYSSLAAMCKEYRVSVHGYKSRLKSGMTKEEALTANMRGKKYVGTYKMAKDHLGNVYASNEEMCKAYGIKENTFYARRYRGMSLEQCLTYRRQGSNGKQKKDHDLRNESTVDIEERTDHLGNVYRTVTEMCKHYGVNRSTYKSRINRGFTKEEALTAGLSAQPLEDRTDHIGNTYDTVSDMCRAYGLNFCTYIRRIKLGWTKEEALTEEVIRLNSCERREVEDHLGNKYPSKLKMCEAYGTTYNCFKNRILLGYTVEEALTLKKFERSRHKHEVKDHLGNIYKNLEEMCRHYGISTYTYSNRVMAGMSLEEALTHSVEPVEDRTDHLGNVYESVARMCRAYGVLKTTYTNRIQRGDSKEIALTAKKLRHKPSSDVEHRTDHNGKVYASIKDMCSAYNIGYNTYLGRLKCGWDKKRALTKEATVDNESRRTDPDGKVYKSIKEMCKAHGMNYKIYMQRIGRGWSKEEALSKEYIQK